MSLRVSLQPRRDLDHLHPLFCTVSSAYYLPPDYLEEKKAKKRVQDLWSRLCVEKLNDQQIFARFMEKTRNLHDYGTKYYHCLVRLFILIHICSPSAANTFPLCLDEGKERLFSIG